jgi:hypothetical protein
MSNIFGTKNFHLKYDRFLSSDCDIRFYYIYLESEINQFLIIESYAF